MILLELFNISTQTNNKQTRIKQTIIKQKTKLIITMESYNINITDWESHGPQRFIHGPARLIITGEKDKTTTKKYSCLKDALVAFYKFKEEGWDVGGIVYEYGQQGGQRAPDKKYSIRREGVIRNAGCGWWQEPVCLKYIGN